MATRVVEGKKPYTGGEAIDINQNKVISLKLRDENNLIIYDSGDDEIYVDLQLEDGIEPTDAFPVGVTTGRVLVADEWDKTGTLICAKTTSGDNIKLLYADDGTLWIDNGTGTFKQIYLSTDIATILTDYATKEYVDAHDTVISSTEPEDPYEGMIWYNTTNDKLKVYNGASWQDVGSGGGGSSYTAGYGIDIDANDEISVDTSEIATQSDLSSKQDELVSGTNIKTINNESLLGSGDITISGGGADIEYKTQAEYEALLPGALTDNKHYFIYTADSPTPPSPWQPGVNTVMYFPFIDDQLDKVGSSSIPVTGTQQTIGYNFSFSNSVSLTNPDTTCAFVSFRIKVNSAGTYGQTPSTYVGNVMYNYSHGMSSYAQKFQIQSTQTGNEWSTQQTVSSGTWYHMAMGYNGTNVVAYLNGVKVWDTASSEYSGYNMIRLGCDIDMDLSQRIGESVCWTAQEVSDYFNATKATYGIS